MAGCSSKAVQCGIKQGSSSAWATHLTAVRAYGTYVIIQVRLSPYVTLTLDQLLVRRTRSDPSFRVRNLCAHGASAVLGMCCYLRQRSVGSKQHSPARARRSVRYVRLPTQWLMDYPPLQQAPGFDLATDDSGRDPNIPGSFAAVVVKRSANLQGKCACMQSCMRPPPLGSAVPTSYSLIDPHTCVSTCAWMVRILHT